ncbi:LRFN4 [Branchiostoma lanceolatum]|uniref:LRFN4 protein n=1 Tax=Branchiostoma lanceolatum TaxID=7740 RepID=A0A8K0EEC6_BRALA|nr:LRFN4 [Branchiostoma lanceolatum]
MGTGLSSISQSNVPCATCNLTEKVEVNPFRCLPDNLVMLQMVRHTDDNGTLEALPRLARLRTLVLGPGNIRMVGSGAFSGVPNLHTLTMSRNCIQTVGKWFGLIWKLKKLYLSWNEIEEIEKEALYPLVDLEHLDLTHNRLRAVENRHFERLSKLKCLKLSYNDISHIAGKAFHPLRSLESILLDHNKLAYFKPAWVEDLPQWAHFHLEHNLLKTIPARGLYVMMRRYNLYVYVTQNPFRCTCVLHLLKSNGANLKALQDYETLECSYPPSLFGRKIADIRRKEMPCPPPTLKVSQQDDRATLVCEVFWEWDRRPEMRWLDPEGKDVKEEEILKPCGGNVTTHLKHELPTTHSPEHGAALSANASGLPYIGRSTYTLRLSPQAFQCWKEGTFWCVVQSKTGKVFANLTMNKSTGPGSDQTQHINGGEGTSGDCLTKNPIRFAFSEKDGGSKPGGPSRYKQNSPTNTTLVPSNATITKRINETTGKNPLQNGTTPDLTNFTVKATINTTTPSRRHETVTEKIIFLDTMDKNSAQDHNATLSYISIACLALFLLGGITTACRKCYKMRQQHRNHVQGNAADGAGNIPPQPAPANATGNPAPVQHAYAEIPDEINTDITPYATTVDMANPMYNATSTEPKALAASIPDPPPRDPPPKSNRHTTYNPSSQPEGTETSRAGMMPDSPPRPDRHINYKASTRPQSSDMTQMRRIQAQPPRSNRRIPYGASSQQSSEIPAVHVREIQDPTPRSKRHINSPSASSQPQGLQTPSSEEVPDLPPRSNNPTAPPSRTAANCKPKLAGQQRHLAPQKQTAVQGRQNTSSHLCQGHHEKMVPEDHHGKIHSTQRTMKPLIPDAPEGSKLQGKKRGLQHKVSDKALPESRHNFGTPLGSDQRWRRDEKDDDSRRLREKATEARLAKDCKEKAKLRNTTWIGAGGETKKTMIPGTTLEHHLDQISAGGETKKTMTPGA